MNLRPIEILGGGLAGLSLGVALRRQAVPVTLHEAGDYPRHRVCGEFITGLADSTIGKLGLAPALAGALLHREVAWFNRAPSPRIQKLPSPALGISRYALDATLAAAFVTLGGDLHTRSRQTDRRDQPGRIFATGRRPLASSPWLGLKIHLRDLELTRDLEMHLGENCYVGLTRVEARVVNLCGLFHRRALSGRGGELLMAYLRASELPDLADRLTGARLQEETFCAVAGLDFDHRLPASERLCLGDSLAMIPPFTGNGMAMAFQGAEAAFGPLVAYARGTTEWPDACRAIQRLLRARFRLRLSSAGLLHPFLLRPRRQRWFAGLGRARLLPFGRLYASLH